MGTLFLGWVGGKLVLDSSLVGKSLNLECTLNSKFYKTLFEVSVAHTSFFSNITIDWLELQR